MPEQFQQGIASVSRLMEELIPVYKRKWSKIHICNAAEEYKIYKLNGGTLKWNEWQKEKFK